MTRQLRMFTVLPQRKSLSPTSVLMLKVCTLCNILVSQSKGLNVRIRYCSPLPSSASVFSLLLPFSVLFYACALDQECELTAPVLSLPLPFSVLFYAYALDQEDLITRPQLEQLVTSHIEVPAHFLMRYAFYFCDLSQPKLADDKEDAEHYKTKIYTWIKGKFKKYATKEKATMMTFDDTISFLQQHPTIMDDLTIDIEKYTDHFHEVEHKRKVTEMLLGRSRSGSDEAIKFHI